MENIRGLRYFVLESDSLGRDGTRAMAEMVIDKFKIKLKAVVFSGNQSDHLWFEHPGLEWLKPRTKLFEAMGFDPKVVRPAPTGAIGRRNQLQNWRPAIIGLVRSGLKFYVLQSN